MKKLTREMLVIESNKDGQDCITCPFNQNGCLIGELNNALRVKIESEFGGGRSICFTNSITLKPEFK